jgi:hypothetical protein
MQPKEQHQEFDDENEAGVFYVIGEGHWPAR